MGSKMGWGHEQQAKKSTTKMWDRIPPTPAQGTLPAPVPRLATGPGGRGGGSFLAAAGCLPAPAGCPWLSRCLRGARLPVARVFPVLARPHRFWGACSRFCSQEPALRDQELRLLCQELRRRWSGAETSSPAARRQASVEVEFTCWQKDPCPPCAPPWPGPSR